MKKLISIFLVLTGLSTAVFAQDLSSETETETKKGVFGTIAEGFATSTRAAHEISKENFDDAREIGAKTYTASRADTKERLSKGFRQGFIDETNKQKSNRAVFQENAVNLRGTRAFLDAQKQFSNSLIKYLPQEEDE